MTFNQFLTTLYSTTTMSVNNEVVDPGRLSTTCCTIGSLANSHDFNIDKKEDSINIQISQNYIDSMSNDQLAQFIEKLDDKEKLVFQMNLDRQIADVLQQDSVKTMKYTNTDYNHKI